jgi:hypothetical protein
VKPIKIQVMPKMDEKNGLCLVGIINELENIEINESMWNFKCVYCILTNLHDKVLHFSSNLMNTFHIRNNVFKKDLNIYSIFSNIPED